MNFSEGFKIEFLRKLGFVVTKDLFPHHENTYHNEVYTTYIEKWVVNIDDVTKHLNDVFQKEFEKQLLKLITNDN